MGAIESLYFLTGNWRGIFMSLPAVLQYQDMAANAEEFSRALALTYISFVWILQLSQL